MEVDWQTMDTAPDSCEEFMVCWCGDWHPRCKIVNGVLLEYQLISSGYENYMEWSRLTNDLSDYTLFWAPQPKMKEWTPFY